jgi:hypothetical protein
MRIVKRGFVGARADDEDNGDCRWSRLGENEAVVEMIVSFFGDGGEG